MMITETEEPKKIRKCNFCNHKLVQEPKLHCPHCKTTKCAECTWGKYRDLCTDCWTTGGEYYIIHRGTEKSAHYLCDFCGTEVWAPAKCNGCGKIMCHKCVRNSIEDDYYCKPCWDKGRRYRRKVKDERALWLTSCKDVN
jgi:hypothetical protein